MAAHTAITGCGMTVKFNTTASVFTADVQAIRTTGRTRERIDTTHMLSPDQAFEYMAACFADYGEVEIDYSARIGVEEDLISAGEDVLEIEHPNGAKLSGTAFCTSDDREYPNNERATGTIRFSWVGKPAVTAPTAQAQATKGEKSAVAKAAAA